MVTVNKIKMVSSLIGPAGDDHKTAHWLLSTEQECCLWADVPAKRPLQPQPVHPADIW